MLLLLLLASAASAFRVVSITPDPAPTREGVTFTFELEGVTEAILSGNGGRSPTSARLTWPQPWRCPGCGHNFALEGWPRPGNAPSDGKVSARLTLDTTPETVPTEVAVRAAFNMGSLGWLDVARAHCAPGACKITYATGVATAGVRVGVLSNHKSSAWTNATCKGTDLALCKCNVELYAKAMQQAKAENVSLLVFPEGYTLGSGTNKKDYFEPFDLSEVGSAPCDDSSNLVQPLLIGLSCAARDAAINAATNVFTVSANGTKHITEIVFDDDGKIVAGYHKHHLFPTEKKIVTPGPFNPTTFELLGRRWHRMVPFNMEFLLGSDGL